MTQSEQWEIVNRNLIAKAIRELVFEQVVKVEKENEIYKISNWTFAGKVGIWGDLRVRPDSIRSPGEMSAAQFFIDIQALLDIDDILLANFLEELHNTLYADLRILRKNATVSLNSLIECDGEELQAFLHGHPKLILNKGRIGFTINDHRDFAPEEEVPLRLFWAAIKKDYLKLSHDTVLSEEFAELDQAKIKLILEESHLKTDDYFLMPFHPWQWERYICMQFAGAIASKTIVPIGEIGDLYIPQISLRTMRNFSHPKKPDIKLPLSILNTSAIRGLSSKYAKVGVGLSQLIQGICNNDDILAHTQVLNELAGAFYEHPAYSQLKNAPYRYHEYIGAIWRESSLSKCKSDEKVLLTGALAHTDLEGKSLLALTIRQSKKTPSQWLAAYTREVIIPLYHLQIKYGIALVAHGQNVMVKLKDNFPVGLVIKDFQGDLRFSQEKSSHYGEMFNEVDVLPSHYLIHDLITGHFITLMRYLSAILNDESIITEEDFYKVMGNEVERYHQNNKVDPSISLLRHEFERVLVNKVRFVIGYSDSAARPKPMLGTMLKNPLVGGSNEL